MREAGSRTLAITFRDNPYENCSKSRAVDAGEKRSKKAPETIDRVCACSQHFFMRWQRLFTRYRSICDDRKASQIQSQGASHDDFVHR